MEKEKRKRKQKGVYERTGKLHKTARQKFSCVKERDRRQVRRKPKKKDQLRFGIGLPRSEAKLKNEGKRKGSKRKQNLQKYPSFLA